MEINLKKIEVPENKIVVKLGHDLSIQPFGQRWRRIKLTRTKILFICRPGHTCSSAPTEVILPGSHVKQDVVYELVMHPSESYILYSRSGYPFVHNGNVVFASFLEEGDVIDLLWNRIKVPASKPEEDSDNLDLLSWDGMMNILLEGETGTGKTTLAKKLHEQSGRIGRFIHINIASYSSGTIESELFGHLKGSFTGAMRNKDGAFYMANRGTLFIDEIDSLNKEIQTKLLLFLDSKKITPVGGTIEKEIDVALIFATGQKLEDLVHQDKFRRDFYFRITSGLRLTLPPLRSDITVLKQFIKSYCELKNYIVSEELLNFYSKLQWPGNYRQVRGHLDKKMFYSKKRKLILDKWDQAMMNNQIVTQENPGKIFSLSDYKYKYCLEIFHKCGGNYKKTAAVLKISPTTLRKTLNFYPPITECM